MDIRTAIETAARDGASVITRRGNNQALIHVWESSNTLDIFFSTDGLNLKDLSTKDWEFVADPGEEV